MAFILSNMSDIDLTELSSAVFKEQKARIIAKVENYPIPVLPEIHGGIEGLKSYRTRTKLSLTEAKTVLDYYRERNKT